MVDPTGFMTTAEAEGFVRGLRKPIRVIAELVEARMWDEVQGGYAIHEFEQGLPAKSTARVQAHRQRKALANSITKREEASGAKAFLLGRDGMTCGWCGKELTEPMVVDHVVPVSKGGSHDLSNLRVLHKRCNAEKWTSDHVKRLTYPGETPRETRPPVATHARADPEPEPVPVPGNASKKATHGVREALSDAVQNGHADDLSLQLARRVSEDVLKRTLSPLEVALCDEFIVSYAYLGVDDIIERMESQIEWAKQQKPPMTPSSLAFFTQSLRVENDHRADAGKPKAWRPPPVAGDLSRLK